MADAQSSVEEQVGPAMSPGAAGDLVEAGSRRRILVDGVFFQRYQTGIARVWTEVLRRWSAGPLGERILLLDRGGLPEDLPGLVETIPIPPFDYADWEGEAERLQRLCDEHDAALFLSTYFTRPSATPSLLLLYDMIPERLGIDLALPMWRQKHDAIRHAAAIACISQSTLSDLRDLFPAEAGKPAVVIHMGISPVFRSSTAEEKAQFHEMFVEPHLGGRRYLLFVGDPGGYKNGNLLVEALSKIDCSTLAILLTRGQESGVIAALRDIPGLIVHVQHLSEKGLQLAYASAHGLIFPSYYEGFGMPIVEAMACGCPVICSGTSSMPEVAGDAALLINPTDAAELAAAIHHLDTPDIRQALIARGLQRARAFSWDRCAGELEGFILECLGESRQLTPCRLCGGAPRPWGRKTVRGRHAVSYGLCTMCGSLQTEPPYWLDEAREHGTAGLNTAAAQRCFDLVQETATLLDLLGFPKTASCVDVAAGTGLYARMMRDRGFNFLAQDDRTTPYYMDGFAVPAIGAGHFRLITGFGILQRLANPAAEIAPLFGADADLVIVSATLYEGQDQDWDALRPESGQEVFFYSPGAMASIASAYGYRVGAARQTFLFVKESYLAELSGGGIDVEAALAAMKDDGTYTARAMALLAAHLQTPYHHAAADFQALARTSSLNGGPAHGTI